MKYYKCRECFLWVLKSKADDHRQRHENQYRHDRILHIRERAESVNSNFGINEGYRDLFNSLCPETRESYAWQWENE